MSLFALGVVLVVLGGCLTVGNWRSFERGLVATRLLVQMRKETPLSPGQGLGEELWIEGPHPTIRARLYGPQRLKERGSIILAPGLHHLSIEEPRLVLFARQLARLGYRVLTPELKELREYRVSALGVTEHQAATQYFSTAEKKVGLIGTSFAGALAIVAAQAPKTASRLRYVASIGGPIELERTLRYLLTDRAIRPGGTTSERRAHPYGTLVLAVHYLEHFNLKADTPLVREWLFAKLKEDENRAKELSARLQTQEAKRLFGGAEQEEYAELRKRLLDIVSQDSEELQRLSPASVLPAIDVPVLLLHGFRDDVVPREETEWGIFLLEKHGSQGEGLVTPLIDHVQLEEDISLLDTYRLLQVMSEML
ncbi:MAG: hypothetical protein MK135_07630 [Polyangiaceae bacterium]|nr:hypothetical protein [Polyangiaceae bacterium]